MKAPTSIPCRVTLSQPVPCFPGLLTPPQPVAAARGPAWNSTAASGPSPAELVGSSALRAESPGGERSWD